MSLLASRKAPGVTPRRRLELTRWSSWAFSGFAISVFGLMLVMLVRESLPVVGHEGLGYLWGKRWFFRVQEFGILPMVYGTAAVAATAVPIAAVLGIGTAIFIGEFLPGRLRLAVKVLIELLAGVPSVVYGILGMLILRDWIYRLLERWDALSGDTLLTGGVLLAVMILPTVVTLSDDALRSVASSQRQAARALGLNRTETILSVCLPQALPGLLAAVLLGLGRAVGETIAVFLVIGRQDNQLPESWLTLRPLAEAGQTLTTKLGGSETFIAYGDPLHWAAIVGLALVLLVLVLGVTVSGLLLERVGSRHA